MQLSFKECGVGEPLLILHGLFGSSDNWMGVAPKLADQFHVFALDLRNHGQSPHSDEMTYSLMAGDVVEFLDARKLASAIVLGHSMGGKVAMQLALDFPGRVQKLVIADMSPGEHAPEFEGYFLTLLALDLKAYRSRQQMEEVMAPAIPNLAMRRFLLKNLGYNADEEYFWKMNLEGIYKNYPRICEAISSGQQYRKPTLFINGGKSNYITEEDKPLIQKLFPEVKFHTIAEAGHWIHADAAVEFVREVTKFLSGDSAS
jgi:pimeloyl-ACP methyl ester carboxylesterase